MAKNKNSIALRGNTEPLSAWNRHKALVDLARYFGTEGRERPTQLEYDLAEDKAYSVQFFVQHWGSWARAVQKARDLVDPERSPQPEPSPFAGYVSCLCGKACHCQERFWSPDRRKIRMCDPCRSWSEKISVDHQLLYLPDDPLVSPRARNGSQRGRPPKEVLGN